MSRDPQIFHSLKQNSLRQVILLLQGGCDVNVVNSSGQTPLIASLVYLYDAEARCKIVAQLIKAGADINKTDRNRKSPLTYACALNQAETVAILLKQPKINPNCADLNGVTPLMLAAGLGNLQVVRVMMEAHVSGSVTIDLSATDNSGQRALDHAMAPADSDNRRNMDSSTVADKVEITRLLAACGGADYSVEPGAQSWEDRQRPVTPSAPTPESIGAIEMADMRESSPRRDVLGTQSKIGFSGAPHRPVTPTAPDESVGDFEMKDMRGSSPRRNVHGIPGKVPDGTAASHGTSNARDVTENLNKSDANSHTAKQWAESLKQEHEAAGRLSALVSPAPSSRPGSRQGGIGGVNLKDKHPPPCKSSLGAGGGRGLRPGSGAKAPSQYRPSSRLRAHSVETEDDDEEEEISLESLKDLKKSRDQEKSSLTAPLAPPAASQQHEVRVEIHAIEEQLKQRVQGRPRPQGPAHSKSSEPTWSGGPPIAMLTVEDEQILSSTWPRGRLRAKSRERFWADTNPRQEKDQGRGGPGHSSVSYPCSPSTSFSVSDRPHGRPQLSPEDQSSRLAGVAGRQAGDLQAANIQHERDILNKAFKKMQKPVPILKSFNKNIETSATPNTSKTDRRLKEQVITSRQSVIQVARQHQQNRQAHIQEQQQQVPSISIIGPGEGIRHSSHGAQQKDGGGALPSSTSQDIMFSPPMTGSESIPPQDGVIPSAEVISDDAHGSSGNSIIFLPPQPRLTSRKVAGLRHRKSVDKGLGSGVVLEKY
ncbi:hypothetical protein EGW08_009671 [Elysia chlorotica]|uniref:Uncharacterized protein n=1 Tax=Elysia chlorotica TaxID=188477 RepID=A0A433TLY8_ELYCH|nr:hypothetical protein EGW08_009671 [Elysia chlorotica]